MVAGWRNLGVGVQLQERLLCRREGSIQGTPDPIFHRGRGWSELESLEGGRERVLAIQRRKRGGSPHWLWEGGLLAGQKAILGS